MCSSGKRKIYALISRQISWWERRARRWIQSWRWVVKDLPYSGRGCRPTFYDVIGNFSRFKLSPENRLCAQKVLFRVMLRLMDDVAVLWWHKLKISLDLLGSPHPIGVRFVEELFNFAVLWDLGVTPWAQRIRSKFWLIDNGITFKHSESDVT